MIQPRQSEARSVFDFGLDFSSTSLLMMDYYINFRVLLSLVFARRPQISENM